MPVGEWTDPHVAPGRWDRQVADAGQRLAVTNGPAIDADVTEALAAPHAADPRALGTHVAQAGGPRGLHGVGHDLDVPPG